MKKLLALILAAALALSLVACGGGGGADDNNTPSGGNGDATSTDTPSSGGEDSAPTEEEPQEEVEYAAIGDMVATDKVEFILDTFQLSEYVYMDSRNPDMILSPLSEEELASLDGDEQYGHADSGKVLATMSFSIKNIGKTPLKDFVTYSTGSTIQLSGYIELDYDGYLFRGDNSVFIDCADGLTNEVSFFGSTTLELDVLEDAHNYKGYIAVPYEVMSNTDKPLYLNIYLPCENGDFETLTYKIR